MKLLNSCKTISRNIRKGSRIINGKFKVIPTYQEFNAFIKNTDKALDKRNYKLTNENKEAQVILNELRTGYKNPYCSGLNMKNN